MTIPQPPDSPQTPPAWNGAPTPDPTAAYAPPAPNGGAPYAAAPVSPPGRVLSIIGLVLAFVAAPIGLILSIVAAVKLGKAGAPKGIAIAGIIVGAVITLLYIIGIILFVTLFAGIIGTCAELGPGMWTVDGVTYTCS